MENGFWVYKLELLPRSETLFDLASNTITINGDNLNWATWAAGSHLSLTQALVFMNITFIEKAQILWLNTNPFLSVYRKNEHTTE